MNREKEIELVNEVLDKFDFHEVQQVMEHMNWTWYNAEDVVPSEYELRTEARRLCEEVLVYFERDGTTTSISTGGLKATSMFYIEHGLPDEIALRLEFVLTDSVATQVYE